MPHSPNPASTEDPAENAHTAHPHLSADTLAAAERAREYWAARQAAVPAPDADDGAASYTPARQTPTGSPPAPA